METRTLNLSRRCSPSSGSQALDVLRRKVFQMKASTFFSVLILLSGFAVADDSVQIAPVPPVGTKDYKGFE